MPKVNGKPLDGQFTKKCQSYIIRDKIMSFIQDNLAWGLYELDTVKCDPSVSGIGRDEPTTLYIDLTVTIKEKCISDNSCPASV